MKTEDCLFFGGPADGEWREVLVDTPQVLIRGEPVSVDPLAMNAWVYKRVVINGTGGRVYPVYVYGNADPVRLLLKYYPVGKNK